jgi:hypothetical protein
LKRASMLIHGTTERTVWAASEVSFLTHLNFCLAV